MRNIHVLIISAAVALPHLALGQSLGEAARQERSRPRPQARRVVTNDDIPSANTSDVAGAARADDSADALSKNAKKDDAAASKSDAWKSKVADAKSKVAGLDREINLMEREWKMRTAVYYADAGFRLRDQKGFADEEQKYQKELTEKKKTLVELKQKLDDLREQARKAGYSVD